MTALILPSMVEERRLWRAGYTAVAGLDEAGRGPVAGPVVAGAAILPDEPRASWIHLVRDSKRLTPAQRETVLPLLMDFAVSMATGTASAEEIDAIGIVSAVRLAMVRAIEDLTVAPDHLLLDAFPLPESSLPQKAVVRGDALCTTIAAASIAAKVSRDRMMAQLDEMHPGYGFARHKGYLTPAHAAALRRLGPSEVHRITFAPVTRRAEALGLFADRRRPELPLLARRGGGP